MWSLQISWFRLILSQKNFGWGIFFRPIMVVVSSLNLSYHWALARRFFLINNYLGNSPSSFDTIFLHYLWISLYIGDIPEPGSSSGWMIDFCSSFSAWLWGYAVAWPRLPSTARWQRCSNGFIPSGTFGGDFYSRDWGRPCPQFFLTRSWRKGQGTEYPKLFTVYPATGDCCAFAPAFPDWFPAV